MNKPVTTSWSDRPNLAEQQRRLDCPTDEAMQQVLDDAPADRPKPLTLAEELAQKTRAAREEQQRKADEREARFCAAIIDIFPTTAKACSAEGKSEVVFGNHIAVEVPCPKVYPNFDGWGWDHLSAPNVDRAFDALEDHFTAEGFRVSRDIQFRGNSRSPGSGSPVLVVSWAPAPPPPPPSNIQKRTPEEISAERSDDRVARKALRRR